jgi:hypothetical protein
MLLPPIFPCWNQQLAEVNAPIARKTFFEIRSTLPKPYQDRLDYESTLKKIGPVTSVVLTIALAHAFIGSPTTLLPEVLDAFQYSDIDWSAPLPNIIAEQASQCSHCGAIMPPKFPKCALCGALTGKWLYGRRRSMNANQN